MGYAMTKRIKTVSINTVPGGGVIVPISGSGGYSYVEKYTAQLDKVDLILALDLMENPCELMHAYGVLVGRSTVDRLLIGYEDQIKRFATILCVALKMTSFENTMHMHMYSDANFKLMVNLTK